MPDMRKATRALVLWNGCFAALWLVSAYLNAWSAKVGDYDRDVVGVWRFGLIGFALISLPTLVVLVQNKTGQLLATLAWFLGPPLAVAIPLVLFGIPL